MHKPGLFNPEKQPSLKSSSFTTDDMNVENGAVAKEAGVAAGEHQDQNAAEQTPEVSSEAYGIFVVDWDGLDDPANPLNWTFRKKWLNMGLISAITLLTYVQHCPSCFVCKRKS